jgi:hypothetical protein
MGYIFLGLGLEAEFFFQPLLESHMRFQTDNRRSMSKLSRWLHEDQVHFKSDL